MRTAGYWVGRARGLARQFRSGFDQMVRESELAEMEKQWAAENERIMRMHPPTAALPAPDQMRAITIEPNATRHAEGSCMISFGDTKVLVTASVEEKVPPFMRGRRSGWRCSGGSRVTSLT